MASENVSRRGQPGRRQDILRIAARTFAERGYHGSSTRTIAERASTATIYYHFDSKEAMILEVITGYLDEAAATYEEIADSDLDPISKMRRLITASVHLVAEHNDEALILYQDWHALVEISPDIGEIKPGRVWASVIDEGIASGDFREDVDTALVYRMGMGAIVWVPRWLRPDDGPERIEEVAQGLADLLLHAMLRPARDRDPPSSGTTPDGKWAQGRQCLGSRGVR